MKKIFYKVCSIRDYQGGAEDKLSTYVRIDRYLYDGPAFAEMDSTVYEIDDFVDIHTIYLKLAALVPSKELYFEYDWLVYQKYIQNLKKELLAMG